MGHSHPHFTCHNRTSGPLPFSFYLAFFSSPCRTSGAPVISPSNYKVHIVGLSSVLDSPPSLPHLAMADVLPPSYSSTPSTSTDTLPAYLPQDADPYSLTTPSKEHDYTYSSRNLTLNLGRKHAGSPYPAYGREASIRGTVHLKSLASIKALTVTVRPSCDRQAFSIPLSRADLTPMRCRYPELHPSR